MGQLATLALAAAVPGAWSSVVRGAVARAALGAVDDLFPLGVASGPGLDGGVVLWTRVWPDVRAHIEQLSHLSLDRYLGERARLTKALPTQRIDVLWELARDPAFKYIVQRGTAPALPELAHSVHVEIPGAALAAGRQYWYRFMYGDAVSAVGRTLTLPGAQSTPDAFRLALASCQHYEYGHFGAYAHMRDDDPQAVLFVGDYIYEGGPSAKRFRPHPFPSARTRFDYRLRHALYRLDPNLQRMHAHCPWWLTWDDHEVSNDYAGEVDEIAAVQKEGGDEGTAMPSGSAAARRRAAYQAYYEHMPLPAAVLVHGFDRMRLYRQLSVGTLAQVFVLDDRQHRDRQACQGPSGLGSALVDDETCPQRLDPQRTLLGRMQMAWLQRGFADSRARWNLVAQQTLFSPLQRDAEGNHVEGNRYWTDGWDGYPAERERVLTAMQSSALRNPVVLGGDVHANWVCDIQHPNAHPNAYRSHRSAALGTELCGTSITSASHWGAARTARMAQSNAHVRFADSTHRGYAVLDLDARQMRITLRAVDDVQKPLPAVSTLARFEVADGQAGAQRVGA